MSVRKWVAGVTAAAVLLMSVSVGMAWAPDMPMAELQQRWAPAPSQFVPVMGMQVHLRDEGPKDDPRPLVLLHGTSASLHTWQGWAEALSPTRRVIRIDLPGFGLTGPMPDGNYQLQRYAEFVRDVLDALRVPQAVLVGNSFGGSVAWKLAVDQPERVMALVLVDSAGYAYASKSVPLAFKVAKYPALAPVMANVLPKGMVESSVRNVYGDPAKVTPELVQRYYELTRAPGNRQALVQRFQQSKGGEFAAQIPLVKVPTLILWGDRDQLIPVETAEQFHKDIAGSRVVVLPGLGHVPHEEDPATSLVPVRAFLESL